MMILIIVLLVKIITDKDNTTNCVVDCKYYYFISYDQYFCTENSQCPIEAPLLMRKKGKCVDNCYNDNEYSYQFNYECFQECPNETTQDEDQIR